jgi:hypothetical protein
MSNTPVALLSFNKSLIGVVKWRRTFRVFVNDGSKSEYILNLYNKINSDHYTKFKIKIAHITNLFQLLCFFFKH